MFADAGIEIDQWFCVGLCFLLLWTHRYMNIILAGTILTVNIAQKQIHICYPCFNVFFHHISFRL